MYFPSHRPNTETHKARVDSNLQESANTAHTVGLASVYTTALTTRETRRLHYYLCLSRAQHSHLVDRRRVISQRGALFRIMATNTLMEIDQIHSQTTHSFQDSDSGNQCATSKATSLLNRSVTLSRISLGRNQSPFNWQTRMSGCDIYTNIRPISHANPRGYTYGNVLLDVSQVCHI